jgi:hypothetical protein
MATLREKIAAEQDARAMIEDHGLPQPDAVEYGHTCIRLLWTDEKVVLVVDIDDPPEGFDLIGERLGETEEEEAA